MKGLESQIVPQIVLISLIEPPQQAIEPPPKDKRILHDPDHGLNLNITESDGHLGCQQFQKKIFEETINLDE